MSLGLFGVVTCGAAVVLLSVEIWRFSVCLPRPPSMRVAGCFLVAAKVLCVVEAFRRAVQLIHGACADSKVQLVVEAVRLLTSSVGVAIGFLLPLAALSRVERRRRRAGWLQSIWITVARMRDGRHRLVDQACRLRSKGKAGARATAS